MGGQPNHSPARHQHQHAHRAACVVASTSREDAAHCGAGPPCTFRYAPIPSQTPTTNNPPRWYPSIHRHNTRTTHSGPPQATPLRASNPRPPPSGPQMIPLYYTDDTQYLPLKIYSTLPHYRNRHRGHFTLKPNPPPPPAPAHQITQEPLFRPRLIALAQTHDPAELNLLRLSQ